MNAAPRDPSLAAVTRLLVATAGLSLVALGLGVYTTLRAPTPTASTRGDELAELRAELAALRHSVELTRSQQSAPGSAIGLAEVERRLARVEAVARAARPAVASDGPDAAAAEPVDEARTASGAPRYVKLDAPSGAVAVEQLANGSLAVRNRDPDLEGQFMVVKARTADGRDEDVTITVPPAS